MADKRITALVATELVSDTMFAALLTMLKRKGILSDRDECEMMESALQRLEERQAVAVDPSPYRVAREIIETHLR